MKPVIRNRPSEYVRRSDLVKSVSKTGAGKKKATHGASDDAHFDIDADGYFVFEVENKRVVPPSSSETNQDATIRKIRKHTS